MANSFVGYPYKLVLRVIAVLLMVVFVVSCSSPRPPSKPHDLCSIFREKPSWYKAAKKSQERWGTPVQIMMSIMYHESSFRHDAQPPRPWFLFIPLPRKSSAYGYAQAQDPVWGEYLEDAAGWFADRDSFSDAIDFIGWYNHKSRKANGVTLWQADLLYLNYHEGWGGFRRGSWKSKSWLKKVAKKVQRRANEYGAQLRGCNL
ncbi:MAG: hypothetical protein QS748_05485 [Candidatus Endonucleobacter bathymodioli]|uniref:Transglycosylase SLT domain-containing protein n=1 Tax=Candidatus Endonucleibacter bathymodioli TaxID=539814 RepID=A0AA90NQH0_9GAMM|nr:hypothetical protein [Candidatus Endonucleobacter bathymodioli]